MKNDRGKIMMKNILETECITKEFREVLDLPDTGKKKAGAFSLGMKQRLGLGSVCILFDNRMGKEENPIYALFNMNLHEKSR